ncbi:MFS transporter [Nocardiopsis synnemataformans]|uniref:MFS transporter n=1 Tax=Nocardiopsis synnemataformans TaxID=61305 RepID=UPI003EC10AF8
MSGFQRPPLWLLALALAAFAVQTDGFIIIGVLPSIASDVDVSEAAAGQLVTVYSLVYALTAPLWAVLFARVSRRRALFWALAVFTAANVAVLLVDGYLPLVALRVVAALAAAVVLPASLAIASTQAPPDHRGRYLATVMMGLTGAILIGVPLGTWTGALLGWQATFVFGGLLGLASLALATRALPAGSDGRAFARLTVPGRSRTVARRCAWLPTRQTATSPLPPSTSTTWRVPDQSRTPAILGAEGLPERGAELLLPRRSARADGVEQPGYGAVSRTGPGVGLVEAGHPRRRRAPSRSA